MERHFAHALSVIDGTESHRDRFWHESQEFTSRPDGRLELSLKLADLLEVERLILQWGGHAEALKPPELLERIATKAGEIVASHRQVFTSAYYFRPLRRGPSPDNVLASSF